MVRLGAASFLGAASQPGRYPPLGPPEVAVAGRSNVGKSSFLNALLGRRNLVRTSRTPGRTRQVNFFAVGEALRLVDLPGYGFAVGSEAERRAWRPLVEDYLATRATLRGVLVLVDVRRGLEDDDRELLDYLAHVGLLAAIVVTKTDKLGHAAAGRAVAGVTAVAGGLPVLPFSARTGAGRDAVWSLVRAWLDAPPRAPLPGRSRHRAGHERASAPIASAITRKSS
ncbi:MAG TPA: ribosome biogenesis GTP-binding protein YihA/YsxC [Candidatus Limnocylindria bacterium]|nr:ribosome biogenesis GTP-binding protein YihA/YsxC [Candidatus Limnocylindria bacterium]